MLQMFFGRLKFPTFESIVIQNKERKKHWSISFFTWKHFSWNCKNYFCNFETKFCTCCLCVSMWNCENTSSLWLISGMELLYLVKLSDFLNFIYKTQTNKHNKNYIRKILQVFFSREKTRHRLSFPWKYFFEMYYHALCAGYFIATNNFINFLKYVRYFYEKSILLRTMR